MDFQMHPYMAGQMTWKPNHFFNPDSGVSICDKVNISLSFGVLCGLKNSGHNK